MRSVLRPFVRRAHLQVRRFMTALVVAVVGLSLVHLRAQQTPPPRIETPAGTATANPVTGIVPPPDYVIGADDVLAVVFWGNKDMSVDGAVVRPDGMITLPLLNEVKASGLSPAQLTATIATAAVKYIEEPNVTVVIKQINSRKVYITGSVSKPGPYPLNEPTTVLQLISKAGGLSEYADKKHILIVRAEKRPDGVNWTSTVNYDDILNRKNLKQNVELKPGDTVIVR